MAFHPFENDERLVNVSFQELDVNFLLRKAATVSTPVMDVSEEGGVWTIKTSTTLKTMELKFKVLFCSIMNSNFLPTHSWHRLNLKLSKTLLRTWHTATTKET